MDSGQIVKAKSLETRVVVIGAGGGGLAAALTAAEDGIKDIVVIEKRTNIGGQSAHAYGIFACESPVQERQGVKTSRDDFFKMFMKWTHWRRVDPRIVRTFIDRSGETIEWLEKQGLTFDLMALHPNQPATGHWPSKGPEGRNVARLIKVLDKNFKAKGGQILLNTSCKHILRGAKGQVAGVVATGPDGEFQVKAKSVIIATGGFAANVQLLKKYCPEYCVDMRLDKESVKTNIGDGLLIADEAGASIANAIAILKGGPHPDMTPIGAPGGIINSPNTVWINKRGKRFINEGASNTMFEAVNGILLQPECIMYSLFDDKIRQEAEEAALSIQGGHGAQIPSKKGLQSQAEQSSSAVKISDSWDNIASWIGVDPEVLNGTINRYNSFCHNGHDFEFIKDTKYLHPLSDPPFYAIRGITSIIDTLGGIKTTEMMECLDNQGNPINGLYAAGVIVDGFEAETYCADLPGSACGFAVNSGRIAGESAAKYILKK